MTPGIVKIWRPTAPDAVAEYGELHSSNGGMLNLLSILVLCLTQRCPFAHGLHIPLDNRLLALVELEKVDRVGIAEGQFAAFYK